MNDFQLKKQKCIDILKKLENMPIISVFAVELLFDFIIYNRSYKHDCLKVIVKHSQLISAKTYDKLIECMFDEQITDEITNIIINLRLFTTLEKNVFKYIKRCLNQKSLKICKNLEKICQYTKIDKSNDLYRGFMLIKDFDSKNLDEISLKLIKNIKLDNQDKFVQMIFLSFLEYAFIQSNKNINLRENILKCLIHLVEKFRTPINFDEKFIYTLLVLVNFDKIDKKTAFELLLKISRKNFELKPFSVVLIETCISSEKNNSFYKEINYILVEYAKQYHQLNDATIDILIKKATENKDLRKTSIKTLKIYSKNFQIFKKNHLENLESLACDCSNDLELSIDILTIIKYAFIFQKDSIFKPSTKFINALNKILFFLPNDLKAMDVLSMLEGNNFFEIFSIIEILMSKQFHLQILQDYESHLWIREILVRELINNIPNKTLYSITVFNHYLASLERKNKFSKFSIKRDIFLEILIDKQRLLNLNLDDINEILFIIKEVNLDLIYELCFNSINLIDELRYQFLYHKLNNFIEKTNELNSQKKILNDLNNLFFKSLNWNILFLNSFMNRIYSNDLNLNNLKTIADFIYENKLPLNLILECMNNHSLNFGSKDSEELGSCDLNEFLFKINVINDYKKYFGDDSNRNNNENKMNEGKFSVLQFMERLKLAKLATFLREKFDLIDLGQETEHFRRNLDEIFDKILIYLKQFVQTDFEQLINNYKDTIVSLMYSLIDEKFIDDQVKKDLIYKKVSRILFYIFFGYNSNDYSFVELVKQLKDLNKMSPNILKYVDEKLEKDLNEIYKANKQKAHLCDFTMSAIESYSIQEIKYWVSEYRKNLTRNQFFNFELIAILKRAMKIHFKYEVEVREIQMISFLLAIQNSGRLLQIKTGEGKSLVVAMIAAYFSLNNKLVDIVTSSSVLAKRDALNFKNFYEILDLKADYNDNILDNQIDSFKDCYGKNIVYGEVSEFQFDILRQEYSFKNVRGKRPFEIVIVDEVDSMMIDENSKIARLSSHMPLIDQLQVFYFIIWRNLDLIDKQFVVIDDQLYFSKVAFEIKENGDLLFFHNKSTSENDSMNDNQKNIELQNEENLLKIDNQLSFFLMIKDQLENSIKNYIFNPDCEIKIPKNYQNFLEEQLPKWIENALIAKYEYKLNHHYVIKNENGQSEIIPVDFENTGVIQTNQSWPDGLQQFIQIKENISLTQESLSTNYLSNIGFFKRYGKNIYGCTGTLGSEMAQSFLCRVYGVDRAIIPSYKCENFYELPSLIAQSKEEWILLCIESIRKETCVNKRAVLAICETVLDANLIRKNLIEKLKFDTSKIKMYTRDDNEETLTIKQTIDCGEIFVATNLAGRGTDIKCTDQVESNGGLHVCVGFLPINLRVEKQAFGRTSRQGNSGTAQLIFVSEKQKNASQIKKKRDSNEKEMLEYKEKVELDQIIFKDELFRLFLDLVKKILIFDQKTFWLETDQDKKQYISLTKDSLFIDNNDILNFSSVDIYKFKAVEEQWGLWLKKSIDVEVLSKEQFNQILKKFNKFKDTLLDNYIHDRITDNCSYFILKANSILFESYQLDKIKACNKGIDLYTKAIEIDKDFAIYAYAFRAYARLHLAKLEQYKKPYKEKVKKDLEDAFNCLNNCILKQLLTINTLAHDPGKKYENINEVTELSNYIQSKCCVLNTLGKYLKKSLDEINNSEIKSKEYDLDVECFKLQDIFSEINIDILNEFSSNGFYGLFDIKKYEPTPWAKIIIVGFIGLAQITAGFLILYYSPPLANLGIWLIEQGVDDILTAVKAAYEGKFSWTEYLISKGISIGVSLCCLGFNKLIKLNCLQPFVELGSIGRKLKKTNKIVNIKTLKIGLNALRNKVIKNVGMRLAMNIRLCDENQANEICEHLQSKKILLTNNCLFSKSITNDNLKEITFLDEKNKNNIIKLINSILDNQNSIHEQYLIRLADELSSQVGNFMASIINKTLITPIGQMMISSAIDFLMKDWDEELLRDLESYHNFFEQKKMNENLNQIYEKGNNFIKSIEKGNYFLKLFKNIFSSDEGKKQIEQIDKKVQKCFETIKEKSAKIIDKYDYSAKAYKKINKVIDYEFENLRNYCVEKIDNFISLNCGHKPEITEISDYFEKTSQLIHLGSNNGIDSAEFFGSLSADSRKTDQIIFYSGRNLPNISNSSSSMNNLNSSITLFNSFRDSRLFYFQHQYFNVLKGLEDAKIYLANRIYKLIDYEKLITNYTLRLQERRFIPELPILDAKDFQLMHDVLNLNTPSYLAMLHFFQLIYNKAPLKDIVKLGEDIIKYLKIEIAINEKKLRDYSIETNIHDNQFKNNLNNCLKQAEKHTTGLNQQFYKELSDINLKQGYEELQKRLRKIEKFDFSLDQFIQKLKLTDNLNDYDVRFITNSFKELDNDKVYSFYYSQLNFNDDLNERTIFNKTLTAASLLFLQINSLRTNLDKTLSNINKIEKIGLFENETLNGFVKKSEPFIHLNKNILDSWELIMNVIIHEASHLAANTDDVIYLFNPLSLHIPSIFLIHNADSIAGASSN
ncbi:DEAD DEAH box helicase family [Brachionus plicatilis]|uniref:DEAD DEAH box helicase family n=1 Tax=Brachionus plicatilis TaxID=10195 RepID=A0A3M7PK67_BRAPC|nr:DEAD DEAH box helicase family [Brachionus plicatilis]